jgi:hypothetical protein
MAVFPVPPATLRTLANATVAPITEERRLADLQGAGSEGGGTGEGDERRTAQNVGA